MLIEREHPIPESAARSRRYAGTAGENVPAKMYNEKVLISFKLLASREK
jgi:hypothetical protein